MVSALPLPLAVTPDDLAGLHQASWADWTSERLDRYGALHLSGFGLDSPEAFEALALQLDPHLYDQYRGTAPRNARTRYVYSSTELASFLPIPQHCEMSFLPQAPRRLFFYCQVAPQKHGETPIVDFRAVYENLDPVIRDEFERRGVRHIRNYNPPGQRAGLDLSKLKTWDHVYGTDDPVAVARRCREEQQTFHFRDDHSLQLINEGPAVRNHAASGRKAWFNHAQVFHPEGPVNEAERVARRQKTLRQRALAIGLRLWYRATTPFLADEERGTQVTFGDGSPIPPDWIRHIQDVIWDHLVFFPWRQGDVLAIDNRIVAHGRMPFKGPRQIMVAWTD
jgi:hypothetical protein